jgi:DNA-binding NtrC family response regulator
MSAERRDPFPRVLLVDDDRDVREALSQTLELANYQVTACRAFIEATDHLSRAFAGVVVTDVRMPGKDGFDLLERVRQVDSDIPVIVLSGQGDIPMAVRAMTEGAYDFLEKPCPASRLLEACGRAWEKRALVLANRRLQAKGTLEAALEREANGESLARQMDVVEKYLIEAALRAHEGRVTTVADALGLPRKTLYDKLKRHDIDPAQHRRRD